MTDDFSKFTAPRADEEIHQGDPVPVTFGLDPGDHLPVQMAPDAGDRPPPLAVDTLVCMEDKRSFVIRNSDGSIFMSFEPKDVEQLDDGRYYVERSVIAQWTHWKQEDPDAPELPNHRPVYSALNLPQCLDIQVLRGTAFENVVAVEPVRPTCTNYFRQLTDMSMDRSRKFLSRSCLAQRGETGEYISVGDTAVFACSLRSPRHLPSEAALDRFDTEKIRQGEERIRAGSFDVDQALAEEKKTEPRGGIF